MPFYSKEDPNYLYELNNIRSKEINDVAAANEQTNTTLNVGALASARRRAGGTTFRRKGSGVAPQQLVSGLGAASARGLAKARKDLLDSQVIDRPYLMVGGVGYGGMGANYDANKGVWR